jgi:hypothetical protein
MKCVCYFMENRGHEQLCRLRLSARSRHRKIASWLAIDSKLGDGTRRGIMQETWRIQRPRQRLQRPSPARRKTENPRERGCWGIASPKRPALGAARRMIRKICPTFMRQAPLINQACSYRTQLSSSLPHGELRPGHRSLLSFL